MSLFLPRKRKLPSTQRADTVTCVCSLVETSADDSVFEQNMFGYQREDSTNLDADGFSETHQLVKCLTEKSVQYHAWGKQEGQGKTDDPFAGQEHDNRRYADTGVPQDDQSTGAEQNTDRKVEPTPSVPADSSGVKLDKRQLNTTHEIVPEKCSICLFVISLSPHETDLNVDDQCFRDIKVIKRCKVHGNFANSEGQREQIIDKDRKLPKEEVNRNNNKHGIVDEMNMDANEEEEIMIPDLKEAVPTRPTRYVESELSSTVQRIITGQNDSKVESTGDPKGRKRCMETICDDADNEIPISENGGNRDEDPFLDYNDMQKRKKRARMCIFNRNLQTVASRNKNNKEDSMSEKITENQSENNCGMDKTAEVEIRMTGVDEETLSTDDGEEPHLLSSLIPTSLGRFGDDHADFDHTFYRVTDLEPLRITTPMACERSNTHLFCFDETNAAVKLHHHKVRFPYNNYVTAKQQSPLEQTIFLEEPPTENLQNREVLDFYRWTAISICFFVETFERFLHLVIMMDPFYQNEFLNRIQISSHQDKYSPQITTRMYTQKKDINKNGNLQEQVLPYVTIHNENLRLYQRLFGNEGNKTYILKGSMGSGKTVFCRKILQSWCRVQNTQLSTESADVSLASSISDLAVDSICSTFNSVVFIYQAMMNDQKDLEVYQHTTNTIKDNDLENTPLQKIAGNILIIFGDKSKIISETSDFTKEITLSSNELGFEKVWICHCGHDIHPLKVQEDLSDYVSLKSKLKTRSSRTNARLTEDRFGSDLQCLDVCIRAPGKLSMKYKSKIIVDANHSKDDVHTLVKAFFKVIDTTFDPREDSNKSEQQNQSCVDTLPQQEKRSDEFDKSNVGDIDLKEKKKSNLHHRIWFSYNQLPLPCLRREAIVGYVEGQTLYTPPTEHEELREILIQLASDNIPGPHITMKYEMLRLCTMKSFPGGERPFAIRIIAAGFYYAGHRDQVICYCCGNRKDNWVLEDIPLLIHQKMAPNCIFLTNNVAVNLPIRRANSAQSPAEVRLLAIQRFDGANQSDTTQGESSLMLPSGEQSQVNISSGTLQILVTNKGSPSSNLMSSGEQNVLDNRHTTIAVVNSVEEPPPKYPQYAVKNMRINSFHGWPAELRQRPEEMAECGFYYAGFSDCVRCFYCGVGLRHWMSEDDPWIEHARWSTSCVYVYKMKGEEFVSLVKMAVEIAEREEAARENGVANQPPQNNTKAAHAGTAGEDSHNNTATNSAAPRNSTSSMRVTGDALGGASASTPSPGTAEIQKYLLTDAAQSVLDMGYQPKLVQRAIERVLMKKGKEELTGLIIMEAIFEIEEEEKAKNKPIPSSQSAEAYENDAKGKLHRNVLNRCLTDLVKDLDFKTVCIYIQQKELFDDVTIRDILEQKTTTEQTRELIKQIQQRGQETYEKFKDCLVQGKQAFLKTLLEEEEAAVSNEIKEKHEAQDTAKGKDKTKDKQDRKHDGDAGEVEGASGEETQIDVEKIRREHRELSEATLCKICLDNTISVVFLPCGHLVTCPDCAPAMRKCPICRALIKGTVKTFYG